jgi:hypothetical protein
MSQFGVPYIGMRNRIKNDIKTYLSGDVTNSAVQTAAVAIAANVIIADYGYAANNFTVTANSITIGCESALLINVSFSIAGSNNFEVTVLPVDLISNQSNPIQSGDTD